MSNLVIVALPAKDDYIHKISSEKSPHLTLLFLGDDATQVKNLNRIIDYAKHAADQSLTRFGLEVDRRGELGPNLADVLFFSKSRWSGFEIVRDYRSYLLKDNSIRTAHESADQHPEWIPHLTLGFPDDPAKPDERDYPGINYVQFDRIAVWFGDYDGIEFPLRNREWDLDVAMSSEEAVDTILKHFGKKGMRWGHRQSLERGDRKFREKAVSLKGRIEVNNAAADHFNSRIGAINNKPAYETARKRGDFLNSSSPAYKKYHKEVSNLYLAGVSKALKDQGTNPSGTKKLEMRPTGKNFEYEVALVDVKRARHSDESYKVTFDHDDDGLITGVSLSEMTQSEEVVEDILTHYGKKGMRWGVRNDSGPQAVSVSDKRKKIKTSGGGGHSAHPDAVRIRTIGQKGKASGLKSLSDKELNDYSKRLNLEANVKRLNYNEKNTGSKFVATVLGQTGKNSANAVAGDVASHQVKKHLTRRLVKIGAVAAVA